MKKTSLIITLLIIFLSNNNYCQSLNLSSDSSILIENHTGRILYEKNAYEKKPMASTTKIMTALLALEYGSLDDSVKIQKDSVGIEGTSIYLEKDEIISLEDLLYGLMLRSGNDAADAIARHIGGSLENFVLLMNLKAKELGALNTNFTNPHGLHHQNHYTTAYDLGLIAREALKNNNFLKITSSKSYKSERQVNNYYVNKNRTIWDYEGGNGVKTGYTSKSGRCLVSSANKNNMGLIAVSLGASDWFNDNFKLLDYGFENYKPYLIYDTNQLVRKFPLDRENKNAIKIVTGNSFFYPLKKDEVDKIKLSIKLDDIKLPMVSNDPIGFIQTSLNGTIIKKDRLVVKEDLVNESILTRLHRLIMGK